MGDGVFGSSVGATNGAGAAAAAEPSAAAAFTVRKRAAGRGAGAAARARALPANGAAFAGATTRFCIASAMVKERAGDWRPREGRLNVPTSTMAPLAAA